MPRLCLFAAGGSTGFSGLALVELAQRVNWGSMLAFVGSVVMMGISWYSAARAAKREQDRLDAEQRERLAMRAQLDLLKLQRSSLELLSPCAPSSPSPAGSPASSPPSPSCWPD